MWKVRAASGCLLELPCTPSSRSARCPAGQVLCGGTRALPLGRAWRAHPRGGFHVGYLQELGERKSKRAKQLAVVVMKYSASKYYFGSQVLAEAEFMTLEAHSQQYYWLQKVLLLQNAQVNFEYTKNTCRLQVSLVKPLQFNKWGPQVLTCRPRLDSQFGQLQLLTGYITSVPPPAVACMVCVAPTMYVYSVRIAGTPVSAGAFNSKRYVGLTQVLSVQQHSFSLCFLVGSSCSDY